MSIVCDPNFGAVSLLLHCDGTNGSTAFPDSSPNNASMTATNVSVDTSTPSFGTGAMNFGAGGFSANVTTPVTANGSLDLGAGDFTIEGWFRLTSLAQGLLVADSDTGAGPYLASINLVGGSTYNVLFDVTTNVTQYSTTSGNLVLSTGVWYAWSVVLHGTTITAYLNGVSGISTTITGAVKGTQGTFRLGGKNTIQAAIVGEMDEIRVTKGLARYTANYTPSGPFPGISCTPIVPNVIGQTQAAGTATLVAAGFQVTPQQQSSNVVAGGIIITHNPSVGTVPLGSNVIIIVSSGPPAAAGAGGDRWGATGGDQNSNGTQEILGHVVANATQPINALNVVPNQSVAAALSNAGSITQLTPALNVPTTPKVGA